MKLLKLSQIEDVLKDADIMGLIKAGAPTDEYNKESLLVFERIYRFDSIEKIQQKCWDVFYSQFCVYLSDKGETTEMNKEKAKDIIGNIELYADIAIKIKQIIGE